MNKLILIVFSLILSFQTNAKTNLDVYETCDLMDRLNRKDVIDTLAKKITVTNNGKKSYHGKLTNYATIESQNIKKIQSYFDQIKLNVKVKSAIIITFGQVGLMMVHTEENKDVVIDLASQEVVGFGPNCSSIENSNSK